MIRFAQIIVGKYRSFISKSLHDVKFTFIHNLHSSRSSSDPSSDRLNRNKKVITIKSRKPIITLSF